MKLPRILYAALGIAISGAGILSAAAQPSNPVAAPPVYVPDTSHENSPLPDGIFLWDAAQKADDATNGQENAKFIFTFTNISSAPVAILSGRGSCSCTTVQLPETPWVIQPGTGGDIGVTINLAGKFGSIFKYAIITTDHGTKNLMLRVNILPPARPGPMSEEDRARGIVAAKLDRQAVFKGDCVKCHAKDIQGKFGPPLYDLVCAVCHEATPRATMVPDLHNLKDPTSQEFWRAWITSGKPGTLMPAFATSQGGPLTDMQITSLAAYLNVAFPSHAPPVGTPAK